MNAVNTMVRMVTLGVLMAIAGTTAAQQAYPPGAPALPLG
jgi:hypothetical protein